MSAFQLLGALEQLGSSGVLLTVVDELARCKDLASRAREMAKHAYNEQTRNTLLAIARDYDALVEATEADRKVKPAKMPADGSRSNRDAD